MTPNVPLLLAMCGPLLHVPFFAPPRMSSTFASWYLPAESMLFQPVSGASMQSSVHVLEAVRPLHAREDEVRRRVRRVGEEDVLLEELRGREDVHVLLVAEAAVAAPRGCRP